MSISTSRERLRFALVRLSPHKAKTALLFLLVVAGIALQVYSPRYLQAFIDQAGSGGSTTVLTVTALLFLALATVRQIVSLAVQTLTGEVTWAVTNRLRLELTKLCLERDWKFHSLHPPGELVERIDGDVGKLNNLLSAFVLKVVGNHLLIAALGIALLLIHPIVGAVALSLSVLALFVLHRMGYYGTAAVRGYMAESAGMLGYLDERIAGREDLRALNAEPHALVSYYRGLRRLYRTRRQTGAALATSLNAGDLTLALLLASSMLCLGLLTLRGASLSLGTMFLAYYYIALLLVPLGNIVAEMSDLQQAGAALQRIGELLEAEADAPGNTGTGTAYAQSIDAEAPLSAAFVRVTFGYDETKPVIRELSAFFPAGKTVGIIGQSGSGKTTLAKLLFRLAEPQRGTVSFNGADARRLDPERIRAQIAYIPQNVELFEGTLRDNIAMFDRSSSDERIRETIRLLRLEHALLRHPAGLDRPIERDGRNVSAGEAQLIAFARAFLKQPKLVILDEATSRVDPATERAIGEAIGVLTRGRAAVVIAHRLTTVEKADFILVMRDGEAVEFGETGALANNPASAYARMRKEAGMAV